MSLTALQAHLETLTAAEVADLFLSPYVSEALLNGATEAAGPAMWIVNRSDVFDQTLEKLVHHRLEGIRNRATEKLRARRSPLFLLQPPEEPPIEEIQDFEVEDVLGNPLASFEAILFFSRALSEDHRASSCLSLTRRLLEHPPNWSVNLELKRAIQQRFFELLVGDPSVFVRAYAARVPLLESKMLEEAEGKETNDGVAARLLQHPGTTVRQLETRAHAFMREPDLRVRFSRTLAVLTLDERFPPSLRRELQAELSEEGLPGLANAFYLGN